MCGQRQSRELGTHLADPVAQRDHGVEALPEKRVEMLAAAVAQVDAALLHDSYRVGGQWLRVASGAGCLDRTARHVVKQRFRDLRARAVAGAQEQDANWAAPTLHRLGRNPDEPESGMQRATRSLELRLAAHEINRVVRVACVRRTAPSRHEPAVAEL